MTETEVQVGIKPAGDGRRLSYREARTPPCIECATSPCCTYLMLQSVEFKTLDEVDYARYLLNFDGILIGMDPNRKGQVYLYQPCGNLDVSSGLCQVHGTADQPSICIHYPAHNCSYRRGMADGTTDTAPLMDHRRMSWYASNLVFDDARKVVGWPGWDEVMDAFRSLPLERHPAPPPPPDPVVEEWRSIVLSPRPDEGQTPHHFSEKVVSDPCSSCDAYCCDTLVFPRARPEDASRVDMFRYSIGFPSVEIGVSNEGWAIIVHTRCRHLDGNRCSVYGTEERPLKCVYYDALKCSYRKHFGTPEPKEIVRVSRPQFRVLAESIMFDEKGKVQMIPPMEVLRDFLGQVERSWASQP